MTKKIIIFCKNHPIHISHKKQVGFGLKRPIEHSKESLHKPMEAMTRVIGQKSIGGATTPQSGSFKALGGSFSALGGKLKDKKKSKYVSF